MKTKTSGVLFYLSLIGFFGIFTTTISKNPVLPYLVKSLGASDQVLGLIAFVSPFAGILFSFPVGVLADKIGKKTLLLVSAGVFVSAPLLYLLVTNAWLLIPVRFFHGMATAILGPIASAIIAGAFEKNKGEKLGTYSSVTLVGRTLAPLTGGLIISIFAGQGDLFSYRAVYVAAFVMSLPVLIAAFFVTTGEVVVKKSLTVKDFFVSLNKILCNRVILATALVDLAIYFAFGIFETFSPGYLKDAGFSPKTVGFIFSIQIVSIALTKPFFGRLADKIDKRYQIAGGLMAIAVSIGAVPFLSSLPLIIAASLLLGLGMSFSTVATSAYVADVAKKEELGASMGALSSIMDLGHSTGPLIGGFAIVLFGSAGSFLAGGAVAVIVVFLFTMISFARPRRSRQAKVSP